MADMGEEFVQLNSQLVRMRPDDILRGLEETVPALLEIRKQCPFVGYDQIRRGKPGPVLGMSVVLRCWRCSGGEVPTPSTSGMSAAQIATGMQDADFAVLIGFLNICMDAFGRDLEYSRLWGALNLTMCMWLYRRVVMPPAQHNPNHRAVRISKDTFRKCLMSLSANGRYLDWLVGRTMSDRDRSPAYAHIRAIFADRLRDEMPGSKPLLPAPAWSARSGAR